MIQAYNPDHFYNLTSYFNKKREVKVFLDQNKKMLHIIQGKKECFTQYISLKNVTFNVNQQGRKKVIETQKKNLHAWVKGFLCHPVEFNHLDKISFVWYNPYETDQFMIGEKPVYSSNFADLCSDMRPYIMVYE